MLVASRARGHLPSGRPHALGSWWRFGYWEPSPVPGGRRCKGTACGFDTCSLSLFSCMRTAHATTSTLQLKLSWKEAQTYVHTESCTWMFRAALFITAQNWTQPKRPSPGEWRSKTVRHPHRGILLRDEKQQTIDTCEKAHEPQKSKKLDTQKNYCTTHLYEISRKGPTMKTWHRSVFSWGWAWEGTVTDSGHEGNV